MEADGREVKLRLDCRCALPHVKERKKVNYNFFLHLSSAERLTHCGLLLPADADATTRTRGLLIWCRDGVAAAVQSVIVLLCKCGAAVVLLRLRGSRLVQEPCGAHTKRLLNAIFMILSITLLL